MNSFFIDEKFLERVGLAELPTSVRAEFLQAVYTALESRVGPRLADSLSDSKLEEFDKIVKRNLAAIGHWIQSNAPDFETDPIFVRINAAIGPATDDKDVLAEYAAAKWLEVTCPNYQSVVAEAFQEIENEIRLGRSRILHDLDPN